MKHERIRFKGTNEEFKRFAEEMNRQGLSVHVEAKISLDMEGHEFDFAVIQLLTIFRLSQELATRLNMSLEEVEDSFIQAACHEASMMSQQQKVDMITRYYGGT